MTSKLKALVASTLMISGWVLAADSFYEHLAEDELYNKIESYDVATNGGKVRDMAEVFVARFPQDARINAMKIKLLSAYIASSKYPMAEEYAERLLSSPVFDKRYVEDVEYQKIMLLIEKSKHWVASYITVSDRFRNVHDLEGAISKIQVFTDKYPTSKYNEELISYFHEIRHFEAEHHIGVALHYAQKGNFDAAAKRLDVYFEQYGDVETPLLDQLLSYPEIG